MIKELATKFFESQIGKLSLNFYGFQRIDKANIAGVNGGELNPNLPFMILCPEDLAKRIGQKSPIREVDLVDTGGNHSTHFEVLPDSMRNASGSRVVVYQS